MKNFTKLIFLTIVLAVTNSITAFAQTSPYKVDEQHYTQDEVDGHYYRYNNIDLGIRTEIVNVYDIPNYTHSGRGFSTNRAHYVLHSSDGTVSDKTGENYNVNYIDISAGDTLQVSFFEVDSMAGDAWFNRYVFIGRNRGGSGIIQPKSTYSKLSVFPNPITREVNLKDINEPFSYMIYDLTGSAVVGGSGIKNQIDLFFLPPGQYILQVKTKNKLFSTKINKI